MTRFKVDKGEDAVYTFDVHSAKMKNLYKKD